MPFCVPDEDPFGGENGLAISAAWSARRLWAWLRCVRR